GNDVFAVGCGYEPLRSIILHYDGTGWSEMDTGTLQPVWGIWGSSGNDVYAVAGTILHYDGANWSRMTW
ncbi:MAG: hypothetical protein SWE60_17235, partial [Thermodesulfobacteriota bacterium]|nr:hypothetical protein [Thermodesulfobacteriota bacterium]